MNFDYTHIQRLNLWRPYVYVRLLNPPAGRRTGTVPMVLDTGSDYCLFNASLAHGIGINPMDGGQVLDTAGVGGSTPTALWPISVEVPELGTSFTLRAQFGQLPSGINGLLGNHGFLDRFSEVCFHPADHTFTLEPAG